MSNKTLLQFFEWYLPPSCNLWQEVSEKAQTLKQLGVSDVWLPPAYKGIGGANEVGYAVYDMYDLGEFNQKGSVATKYGTNEQYISAVKTLRDSGLNVLADIVFNHRMGADATENVNVKVFDNKNRNEVIGQREISAYTKFTFPARGKKYSDFEWNSSHFDGCDWDDKAKQSGVYLFADKNWDDEVDIEHGNYDYLMGADIDLSSEQAFNELVNWGKWYLQTAEINGFRLDAIKHIKFSKMAHWVWAMREFAKKDLFAVGEYWSKTLPPLLYYLDKTANSIHLFDVPLHFNFYNASINGEAFDMGKIFEGTLLKERSSKAVTFVDNHDTQPGQALESFVKEWFKLHAYALILLMQSGTPCVFYGDLYGIPHNNIKPLSKLQTLMAIRKNLAYGEQIDYFSGKNIVGLTRTGDVAFENSGLALIMTNAKGGEVRMCMGKNFIGKTMVDALQNCPDKITVGEDGCASFKVYDKSVSVYVLEGTM